jgi:carbamoyl-phosphate synthase large subunit
MSRSYGEAIRTTAYLSERFNIPFIPFSMTDCFINKRLMKNTLLAASIPTPEVVSLPTGARLTKPGGNFFPLIRKPVEGHAKIGVRLINNIKQLKESIPSQAEKKNFIFEKYIEGDEIIVAGVVHHGRFHVVDITDKTTTQLPYFVDLKHVSPSRYYHLSEMISSIGQSVARAFSIVNSPVIMEFIVDNNGNLHLIEAAPEFGGEFLADVAIPIRTGYNFIGEAIKANTGMNFRPPSGKKSRKAVVVRYITDSEGTLQSFNPEGPKHIRGVVFSRIFKEIGAAIKPPTNNLDRIGVVITKARTPDEADEIAERAVESLQIRIRKQS